MVNLFCTHYLKIEALRAIFQQSINSGVSPSGSCPSGEKARFSTGFREIEFYVEIQIVLP